jgi:hypothetical protein
MGRGSVAGRRRAMGIVDRECPNKTVDALRFM